MTTAVQIQYRRGSAAEVAAFVGAAGEMVIDTTNNRVVVQDGSTTGGWPAAKLSEVVTNTRTQVSDGNYSVLSTDRTVAYITLTAARTVSLPAATAFPAGSRLLMIDESGACSPTRTITLDANGSDLIDGVASAVISSAYGYLAIESNGYNKWTIIDQVSSINALTGAIAIASSGGSTITASGTTVTIGEPGGSRNGFYNAAMDVWQRGTSGTATTTAGPATQIGPDGWYVVPAGASVSWAQGSGRLITKNSLQVTGATSVTDVIIKQRIESLIAARFCSQSVTVQAQICNGTGASITPTLTVKHAGSVDSWGSPTTDVSAATLQACANGAWTLVAYTFSANAASYNGLEVSFDFGNSFGSGSKQINIAELDIRVTPGVSAGLNANPPPPELRPVGVELPVCGRYYQVLVPYCAGLVADSADIDFVATFAAMRAAPTVAQATVIQVLASGNVFTQSSVDFVETFGVSTAGLGFRLGNFSGLTAGATAVARAPGGYLTLSAEL